MLLHHTEGSTLPWWVSTEIFGTAEDCSFKVHYYYVCMYVYLSYLLPRILLLLRPPTSGVLYTTAFISLTIASLCILSSWDTLLSGGIVPAGYQLQTSCDSVSHYNYIDHAMPARQYERQLEQPSGKKDKHLRCSHWSDLESACMHASYLTCVCAWLSMHIRTYYRAPYPLDGDLQEHFECLQLTFISTTLLESKIISKTSKVVYISSYSREKIKQNQK